MNTPKFSIAKKDRGWCVNVPSSIAANGKPYRRYFASKEKAQFFVADLKKQYHNHGAGIAILPPEKSSVAIRAFNALGDRPPETLIAAVNAYLAREKAAAASVTFATACDAYSEACAHRTSAYVACFKRLKTHFADISEKLVSEIEPSDLESVLSTKTATVRNANRRELRAVFNFAIKKKWLEENPVKSIDQAHVGKPKRLTLTPAQVNDLFWSATELDYELLPYLAVTVFAGVRPGAGFNSGEALELKWSDFDWRDNVLHVSDEVSKTELGRFIHVHKTLREWFDYYCYRGGNTDGLIVPETGQKLRRRLNVVRKHAGLYPWPQDASRRTFASAALASGWRDISALTLDMGHRSPDMLWKHYHRAMKREDAERFWQVLPQRVYGNIVAMTA